MTRRRYVGRLKGLGRISDINWGISEFDSSVNLAVQRARKEFVLFLEDHGFPPGRYSFEVSLKSPAGRSSETRRFSVNLLEGGENS